MSQNLKNLVQAITGLGVRESVVDHIHSTLTTYETDLSYWLGIAIELRPNVINETLYHATELVYMEAIARFQLTKALAGNYGLLLLNWGRLDEAAAWLQKSLQLDSAYFHGLHHMGYCLELGGNHQDAEPYYRRALEIKPTSALTWNGLANVLWETGKPTDSISAYQKAISVDPCCTDALFNISIRHLKQGKFEEADRYITRLLLLTPSDQQAILLRNLAAQKEPPPNSLRKAQIPLGVALRYRLIPDIDVWPRTELWKYVVALANTERNPIDQWPPRIFLSHRWGDGEYAGWVREFANDLRDRGYEVVFDRKYRLMDEPIGVPEVLGELSRSSYFVPILTERYRRSVEFEQGIEGFAKPIERSVVMDEWLAAFTLASRNRMRILPVWLAGPVVPRPLSQSMVVDVREQNDYWIFLERFPKTGSAGKLIAFEEPETTTERSRFVTKSGNQTFTADTLEIQWSREIMEQARAAVVRSIMNANPSV